MKVSDKVVVKIQYIFLVVVLIFQILVGVIVIGLYLESRQGGRFTYCDGLYLQYQIDPNPKYLDTTCNNNTRFQNFVKGI